MQSLIMCLAVLGQEPASLPQVPPIPSGTVTTTTTPTTNPNPALPAQPTPAPQSLPEVSKPSEVQVLPSPPAPTKMPPIPGKVMPVPVPPAKAAPAPVPPTKTTPPAVAPTAQQEVLGPDRQAYFEGTGWCVGQEIVHGPPEYVGKWRIKYKVTNSQGTYTYKASGTGAPPAGYGDPYGFTAWVR